MRLLASDYKDQLIEVLYARHDKAPPLIGLPASGALKATENSELAYDLHKIMNEGDSDTEFYLPRYTRKINGQVVEVTARETYRKKLLHHSQLASGSNSPDNGETAADVIKRAAYDTFCLHAEKAGLFSAQYAKQLNDKAQAGRFADFETLKNLLTQTPVEPPSIRQYLKDTFNAALTSIIEPAKAWKHNRRRHNRSRELDLTRLYYTNISKSLLSADPDTKDDDTLGKNIPESYVAADLGLTYKF